MSELTAGSLLASALRMFSANFAKDLAFLPEGTYLGSPGGSARSGQDITAEVAGFLGRAVQVMKREEPVRPSPEQMAAYEASLSTPELGAEAVLKAAEELALAIEADPERLSEMITAPWGAPMAVGGLINIAATHIMYHDGQLNMMQLLAGDEKVHWFE